MDLSNYSVRAIMVLKLVGIVAYQAGLNTLLTPLLMTLYKE